MCFHIIKYVFSNHHTHISVCHFVGVYVYAGAINRPLRLLTVCQLRGEHSAKHQRSPTKWGANTPPGVGADSSRPYPNIIKYVFRFTAHAYPHYQLRVFTPSHAHFHITTHAFSSPFLWVFSYTRAR